MSSDYWGPVSLRVLPEKQNQREIYVKRFIARNCLCNCGSWPGKSEICSTGCQEGQAGTLRHELKLLSMGRISPAKSHVCLERLSTD